MKFVEVLLLIVGGLLFISIIGNVWLGAELSQEKNKDCISLSEFNKALSEAQNKTTEIGKLYNKSQEDLSKCYSDLDREKEKKKPLNITIDHIWTFIIGVSLGSIIWLFLRILYLVAKNETKKK